MTSASTPNHQPYKFPGFLSPNYTQVPDVVFDELLEILSGAELKVLLYIIRRTFGFKKASDDISLNQMLAGIVRKGGERLDRGCGIRNRTTLSQALQSLEKMGIIVKKRNTSPQKKDLPTTYSLKLASTTNAEPPEKNDLKRGTKTVSERGTKIVPSLVRKSYPQETVKQETEQQHVVAALTTAGISRKAAEKLIGEHQSEYLLTKASYLEFLQSGKETRVKRPAGWLRRAIEEDFAAPDGYKSPEVLAEEEEHSRQAHKNREEYRNSIAQTLRQEDERQARREREKSRFLKTELERLRAEYQTSKAETEAWKGVKTELEKAYPGSLQVKTALDQGHLMSVRDGVAVFACMNKFAAHWLGTKLEILVRSQLKEYGLKATRVECFVITSSGGAG